MTGDSYDLIVVGGGGAGLSTAYHAGRRGLRTLVLERFGVGAFCTAESVLVDKLGLDPIIDTSDYPLICGSGC